MDRFGVQLHMEEAARARAEWNTATTEFRAGYDKVMARLLHEAVYNKMTRADIGKYARLTAAQVRNLMRKHGMNPRHGKTVLSDQAGEALRQNAALMGVKPEQMDLTSPLAYLPMGDDLRRRLEAAKTSQVKEIEVHYEWCKGTCGGSCGRSMANLGTFPETFEERVRQAVDNCPVEHLVTVVDAEELTAYLIETLA